MRGQGVQDAMARNGAVYMVAIGGAGEMCIRDRYSEGQRTAGQICYLAGGFGGRSGRLAGEGVYRRNGERLSLIHI